MHIVKPVNDKAHIYVTVIRVNIHQLSVILGKDHDQCDVMQNFMFSKATTNILAQTKYA